MPPPGKPKEETLEEILAAGGKVLAPGETGGVPADPRGRVERFYQDVVAKPATRVLGAVIGAAGEPDPRMMRALPPDVQRQMREGQRQAGQKIAETVFPQDTTDVGIDLATGGMGFAVRPLIKGGVKVLARPTVQALARLGAATGGGAVAGATTGGQGAVEGGARGFQQGLAGEAFNWFLGKLARESSGAKTRISDEDARRFREFMGREDIAPDLGPTSPTVPGTVTGRPSEQIHMLRGEEGRTALGLGRDPRIAAINNVLQGQKIVLPSLGMQPVSLQQANQFLTAVGEGRIWGRDVVDDRLRNQIVSEAYGRVSREIREGLQRVADANTRRMGEEYIRIMQQWDPRGQPRALGPAAPGAYPRQTPPPEGVRFEAGPMTETDVIPGWEWAEYLAGLRAKPRQIGPMGAPGGTQAVGGREPGHVTALPPTSRQMEHGPHTTERTQYGVGPQPPEGGRLYVPETEIGVRNAPIPTGPPTTQKFGYADIEPRRAPGELEPDVPTTYDVYEPGEVTPNVIRETDVPAGVREVPQTGPQPPFEERAWYRRGEEPQPTPEPEVVPEGRMPHEAPEIETPDMGRLWDEAQGPYSRGMLMLEDVLTQTPGMFRRGPEGPELNFGALQRRLTAENPADKVFLDRVKHVLGERFPDFVDVVSRGAGLGRVDRVVGGSGLASDVVGEQFTGNRWASWAPYAAIVKALLPGMGSKYVAAPGRAPGELSPDVKAGVDLVIERILQNWGPGLGASPRYDLDLQLSPGGPPSEEYQETPPPRRLE